MEERVSDRNGFAHVAHLINRLYEKLLVSVRVLSKVNIQRAFRHIRIGRAVDLHGGDARMSVRCLDVQILALYCRLKLRTFLVKARNRHAFLMLLTVRVSDEHLYSAVVEQI